MIFILIDNYYKPQSGVKRNKREMSLFWWQTVPGQQSPPSYLHSSLLVSWSHLPFWIKFLNGHSKEDFITHESRTQEKDWTKKIYHMIKPLKLELKKCTNIPKRYDPCFNSLLIALNHKVLAYTGFHMCPNCPYFTVKIPMAKPIVLLVHQHIWLGSWYAKEFGVFEKELRKL